MKPQIRCTSLTKKIGFFLLLFAFLASCSPKSKVDQPLRNNSMDIPTMTPEPVSVYRITNVTVVDVEKGTTIPNQTVIVSGDRIEMIGATAILEIPEGAQTIDAQGLYLMPGLADAHV